MEVEAWLVRAAAADPQRIAVGTLSYAQLTRAAHAAARRLAASGARPGDEVAIALPPGEAFAIALHATLLLGAVAVPVDPALPDAERARRTARAAVVLDVHPDDLGHEDPAVRLRPVHDLDAPAVIVHTSGTSGAGTPIPLTYGNWLWSALGSAVALGLDPAERWLCCLPVTHVGGLSILLRSAIYGTTAVVHERFDTERVLAALQDPDGPTLVSLVPTTLARLLDAGLREPPALRWALLGGAAIPPALLERAARAGVPVAPTYGMTEACSQIATFDRPLFCTRVQTSAEGELLVRGPTVSPAAQPVLHTGDLGTVGPEGRVAVTGRLADTVITGGENVAPVEVEAVLLAHPDVADAGVHGRPDPAWGERVVATVVLHPGAQAGPEALRAWCAQRLAPHQVPKAIEVADALPRTPSGKLLRRAL